MSQHQKPVRQIKHIAESFQRRLTLDEELKLARGSPAFWWYCCLRDSNEYKEHCRFQNHAELAETYGLFGNVFVYQFDKWWRETGRHIFTLQTPLRKVRHVKNKSDLFSDSFGDVSVIIEVPLTIRKQTALNQIRKLLNDAYKDKTVDIQQASTALVKYQKSKIRMSTVERLLKIYRLRARHPNITLYELGNRAGVELDLFARNAVIDEQLDEAYERRRMTIAVSRYLKQADNLLHNAARGIFPSLKPANKASRAKTLKKR